MLMVVKDVQHLMKSKTNTISGNIGLAIGDANLLYLRNIQLKGEAQKLATQQKDARAEIDNLKQRLRDMENGELNMSQLMDEGWRRGQKIVKTLSHLHRLLPTTKR